MLKLQYCGHLMQRADSLERTLMLGKIEGKRRRRWQRMRWLDGITDSRGMSMSILWEIVKNRETWCAAVHGVTKSWTWFSNWTTTTVPTVLESCVQDFYWKHMPAGYGALQKVIITPRERKWGNDSMLVSGRQRNRYPNIHCQACFVKVVTDKAA